MNLKTFTLNYAEKVKDLSKTEMEKYKRAFSFINSFEEKILQFENPEKIYELVKSNPKWQSVNTWETNFAKITAIINVSDKELGQKYVDYRNKNIKPEVKNYSNNRVLKTFSSLKYKGDDNDYKRLLLNLYIKYPPLRTDYCTVKLKNYNKKEDNYYEKGVIYFNHLIKNDNTLTINLEKEEQEMFEKIKNEKEFLFKEVSNDMSNDFVRAIRKYSFELIGEHLSINDFRRRYFTDFMKSVKSMEFPEAYILVKDIAQKSNTSIEQMINYYYGKEQDK